MSRARMVKVVFGTVTFTVPVTLTLLDTFGYVAKVEGVSMQPSLNPQGQKVADYVFLNKWAARHSDFQRGEVVSLISPSNASQRLIKRIVGVEGDTVKTLHFKKRFVKVPQGHCWIEGDHHGHSLDSNLFGPVSISLIQAKASYIVWPPERWQEMKVIPIPQRTNSSSEWNMGPGVSPVAQGGVGKDVKPTVTNTGTLTVKHPDTSRNSLKKSSVTRKRNEPTEGFVSHVDSKDCTTEHSDGSHQDSRKISHEAPDRTENFTNDLSVCDGLDGQPASREKDVRAYSLPTDQPQVPRSSNVLTVSSHSS